MPLQLWQFSFRDAKTYALYAVLCHRNADAAWRDWKRRGQYQHCAVICARGKPMTMPSTEAA